MKKKTLNKYKCYKEHYKEKKTGLIASFRTEARLHFLLKCRLCRNAEIQLFKN